MDTVQAEMPALLFKCALARIRMLTSQLRCAILEMTDKVPGQ